MISPVALAEAGYAGEPHDHAIRFLNRLAQGESVTFQTFDDGKQGRLLARIFHGTLKQHWRELVRLNEAGAGIYTAINRTDGHGRRAENITAIRALFLDLDGAPLEPVLAAKPQADLIVETSAGRYQALWLISDCPVAHYAEVQAMLAARFGGDPAVTDPSRVCRLPGYWHLKGMPQLSRLFCERFAPHWQLADIVTGLGLKPPEKPKPQQSESQPLGILNRYCEAALKRACAAIINAPNGQQATTLNREAFATGQLVENYRMVASRALPALIWAGKQMTSFDKRRQWCSSEIEKTVHRAFTAGQLSPKAKKQWKR
jgi:hypothetical protein